MKETLYAFDTVIQYPANITPKVCLDRDCVGFRIQKGPDGYVGKPVYGKKEDYIQI